MSLNKEMVLGIAIYYLKSGVVIDKIDRDNHILYITVPKESYMYEEEHGAYNDAESYVKRLKKTWIEMGIFPQDFSVKYKTKDVYWTKEMGEDNYKRNQSKIFDLSMAMHMP